MITLYHIPQELYFYDFKVGQTLYDGSKWPPKLCLFDSQFKKITVLVFIHVTRRLKGYIRFVGPTP